MNMTAVQVEILNHAHKFGHGLVRVSCRELLYELRWNMFPHGRYDEDMKIHEYFESHSRYYLAYTACAHPYIYGNQNG